MGASSSSCAAWIRRSLTGASIVAFALGVEGSPSGAASSWQRPSFIAATTNTGNVLLALVGGLLVLVGIGTVAFTLARRKKRPSPCAEQREALALAEKAVQYWEAVRAHVLVAESERLAVDGADSLDVTHATQLAKAVEGLSAAVKERDQCEMDLIHCMASGVQTAPPLATSPHYQQPFFIPVTDELTPENPPQAD